MNEAMLFNMRNAYQNYNVAVNLGNKVIYTYMGVLQPRMRNANYCTAGQLSPLLNDPLYRTVGAGTRIFLGGGQGYVVSHGTQHNPGVRRTERGVPKVPAGTLSVTGDLKQMSPRWLRGASFTGYGVTLTVGVGLPIPILNEESSFRRSRDEDPAPVVDYSDVSQLQPEILAEVMVAQPVRRDLWRKVITRTFFLRQSPEIALTLKQWLKLNLSVDGLVALLPP
jgi:uncharacterized protein (DUF39 family)